MDGDLILYPFSARDCLMLIVNTDRRKGSLRHLRDYLVTGFSSVYPW